MINRLSAPYNLVQGQVLDLCYKHRVAASETIYDIARKYGLSYTELYPMNPHLFDSEFIFAGQEVCVMPAMKRIMCGAPARVADSTGLRGSQGRASSGDSTSSFSVGATW
jgi:LysM repeat protein